MNRHPAVFLDRDGVLNNLIERDGGWFSPRAVTDFQPIDCLGEAIQRLVKLGFLCVVVTNQPDVARGHLTKHEVDLMNAKLIPFGLRHFYVCPHDDDDLCICRKPRPGLLDNAIRDLSIDSARSWLIGDRSVDIDAARAAGVKAILIKSYLAGEISLEKAGTSETLLDAVSTIEKTVRSASESS